MKGEERAVEKEGRKYSNGKRQKGKSRRQDGGRISGGGGEVKGGEKRKAREGQKRNERAYGTCVYASMDWNTVDSSCKRALA